MRSIIKLLLFAIISIISVKKSTAQVVINEYSAANYAQFPDDFGGHEDWIEFYNKGNQSVDLKGYFVSDDDKKPKKWQFPDAAVINPNGFLRIWCSSRNVSDAASGNFHTNFKLSQTKKKNEHLIFADKTGKILEDIKLTETGNHQSWARVPDGGTAFFVNLNPSPNQSNAKAKPYKGFAEKPTFSIPAGFYDKNQKIALSVADSNNIVIRYTLDGKEPSANSPIYKTPILIDTTKILKARSFHKDPLMLASFVQFNTYFIRNTHSLIVISVSGDSLELLANGNKALKPVGSIEYFRQDKSASSKGYGEFNPHGQDSWANSHRSIDFEMRDEFGYNDNISEKIYDLSNRAEFQKMILRAAGDDNYPADFRPQNKYSAHIRDAYVQNLAKRGNLKLDVRTGQKAVVYINGKYWGLYDLRERPDDHDYTNYYYGQDKYNIQYIQTWGNTWAEYGGNQALTDWNQFYDFLNATSTDITKDSVYQKVKSQYDVESLVDYVLVNSFTVCSDWLNYNTGWWRGMNPSGGHKKWAYTLWDNDAVFAFYINYTGIKDTSATASICQHELLKTTSDPKGHIKILNKLRKNKEFDQYYITRQADLFNTVFSKQNMLTYFDSVYNVMKPEMPRQVARWGGTMAGWESNVKRLRNFIERRCDAVQTNIKPCYALSGPYPLTLVAEKPQEVKEIQFNSMVINQLPWTGKYYGGIDNKINITLNDGSKYDFNKWIALKSKFSSDSTKAKSAFKMSAADTIRATFKLKISDTDDNVLVQSNLSIYPNVANNYTNIEFYLPEAMPVAIEIFDLKGQKVGNLAYQIYQEGEHQVAFDLTDFNLSNGLYVVKFSAGKYSTTGKLLIQK
jgi:CotH kinase protein/Lamin Tail Domain/Chitobiase/beta-hexosaminidase C-terminal domain/Secretion system C-terminal sorting domain